MKKLPVTELPTVIKRYYDRRFKEFKRAGFSTLEADFAARQGYKLTDPSVRLILENRRENVRYLLNQGFTRKEAVRELARQLKIKLQGRKRSMIGRMSDRYQKKTGRKRKEPPTIDMTDAADDVILEGFAKARDKIERRRRECLKRQDKKTEQ